MQELCEQFVPEEPQRDLWMKVQADLFYAQKKDELSLQRNHFQLGQRLDFEAAILEMKARYTAYVQTIGSRIYADAAGNLIYSIEDQSKKKLSAIRLLDVSGFRAKIYRTTWPKCSECLTVEWNEENVKPILFSDFLSRLSTNLFLRRLKMRGLFLRVSGKNEKRAADQLMAYAFSVAECVEIPFFHGWNRMENGEWHFAGPDVLTMEELNDADV